MAVTSESELRGVKFAELSDIVNDLISTAIACHSRPLKHFAEHEIAILCWGGQSMQIKYRCLNMPCYPCEIHLLWLKEEVEVQLREQGEIVP